MEVFPMRRQRGICLLLLLVLAIAAGAQETKTGERGGFSLPAGGGPQLRTGQLSAQEQKKMKEERQKWLASLKLTPDQQKKWDEIEARYSKLLKEKIAKQGGKDGRLMVSGSSGDVMKTIQELQGLQTKKRDEQRALLTPPQRPLFDKAPDPGFRTRTILK
jgi:hypothetical protein